MTRLHDYHDSQTPRLPDFWTTQQLSIHTSHGTRPLSTSMLPSPSSSLLHRSPRSIRQRRNHANSPPYISPYRNFGPVQDRSNFTDAVEDERATQREKNRELAFQQQETPSRRHRRVPTAAASKENRSPSPTPAPRRRRVNLILPPPPAQPSIPATSGIRSVRLLLPTPPSSVLPTPRETQQERVNMYSLGQQRRRAREREQREREQREREQRQHEQQEREDQAHEQHIVQRSEINEHPPLRLFPLLRQLSPAQNQLLTPPTTQIVHSNINSCEASTSQLPLSAPPIQPSRPRRHVTVAPARQPKGSCR
ncbi:hypothetical protein MIND_01143900 [Mycena indigotica]|uniref:Uncharacterized protein n=1 Tax=Mycena indigotica TaxID=2126181 RepID=A0A8H6VXD0_9AGAR|nr:uncharacterized protein MIND_01143900 [Mycena indigotica]KAF7293643.1 hypothetical protein MIND_01143900 [Mycena indigotica]